MCMKLLILLLCFSRPSVVLGDPCITADHFTGDEKRSVDNHDINGGLCDAFLSPGWYRLWADGVDVDMATTAPTRPSCNTNYPIWLNGNIPLAKNKEADLTACVVGYDNCTLQLPVRVINCGQYRVYNLVPATLCLSAYCFGNYPKIDVKPTVSPLIAINERNPNFEELRFDCVFEDFPNASSLYFDVIWRINNDEVVRFINKEFLNLHRSTQLKEFHWKHGYKLGMNVQCGVRARLLQDAVPSPEKRSEVFFAGLKVLQPSIALKEGKTATVSFQATIPIPCIVEFPICSVLFVDISYENTNGTCDRQNLTSGCGFTISSDNWNATHELNLEAHIDNIYESWYTEVILKSTNPWLYGQITSVWADVVPQKVMVTIHDTDADATKSRCTIISDPHIRTFDRGFYDIHKPGEFVLYRHKHLPIEVRGFFEECRTGRRFTQCPCGAAVKSGSQIFVHSKCRDNYPSYRMHTRLYAHGPNGCAKRQMRILPDKGGYKVEVLSGLEVKIYSNGNIQIRPSSVDVNQVQGLCGNFNGNFKDDLKDQNGTMYKGITPTVEYSLAEKGFASSWKIENENQSFYSGKAPLNVTDSIDICTCPNRIQGQVITQVKCTSVQLSGCDRDNLVADVECTQVSSSFYGRRKRAASMDDTEEEPVFPILPDPDISEIKDPEWTNGWSEEKAREHCETHFRKSPAFAACSEVQNLDLDDTILNCMADIKLTGETEWTANSLETFKQDCLSEVNRNTTLWKSEDGKKSVYDLVVESVCPNECNARGPCVKGHCECSENWLGDDCSVDGTNPPVVMEIINRGMCNMDNKDCTRVVLFGTYFARVPSLKCQFVQVYVTGTNAMRTIRDPYITLAGFRSPTELVCSLPHDAPAGRSGNNQIGYMVSVSNVNDKFGPAKLFVPYRSGECQKTGDGFSCKDPVSSCQMPFSLTTPADVRTETLTSNTLQPDDTS